VLAISLIKAAELNNGSIVAYSEEHFGIGYEFYSSGTLTFNGVQSVFRAPGYPVFVAISLHARDFALSFFKLVGFDAQNMTPLQGDWFFTLNWLFDDGNWVMFMQLLLLLLGGAFFYITLRIWLSVLPASLFLVSYLLNPLTASNVRFLSYPLLDLVMITILVYICFAILNTQDINIWILIGSSLYLAMAALVRPIFLTFPILLFSLFLFARGFSFQDSAKKAGLTLLFLVIFISPYLIRNYSITGSLVPISNQGSWAFWGNSVTLFYSNPTFPELRTSWTQDIWEPFGKAEFKKATGLEYSLSVLYRNSQYLSGYFGKEFVNNLVKEPSIYTQNLIGNVINYIFALRNREDAQFWRAYVQDTNSLSNTFSTYNFVATLLVIPTLGYFAFRKNIYAILGLLLVAYFAMNYSIVFLTNRYLYSLMPVLWVCFAICPGLVEKGQGKKILSKGSLELVVGCITLFCHTLSVFMSIGV
jgi:hypothetical protein